MPRVRSQKFPVEGGESGERTHFLDRLCFVCLFMAVFLLPFFFLPFTLNRFEFNKQVLLFVLAIVAALSWLGKSIRQKQIRFLRTPLDIPLLVFLGVYAVSTIFSQDWLQSLIALDRAGLPSLLSVCGLVLFYVTFINTINTKKDLNRMIFALCASVGVVLVMVLVSAYRMIPLPSGLEELFNPLDQISSLVIFIAAAIPVVLALLLNKKNTIASFVFFLFIFFLALITLNVVNFNVGWTIAGIGGAVIITVIFSRYNALPIRPNWIWLATLIVVLGVLRYTTPIPSVLNSLLPNDKRAVIPQEVTLTQNFSWDIARTTSVSGVKDFLIGVGPGNFVYSFSRFRPETYNNGPFWAIRFQTAASNVLELIVTTGWSGLFAWLAFIALFIVFFVRSLLFVKNSGGQEGDTDLDFIMLGFFACAVAVAGAGLLAMLPITLYFLLVFAMAVTTKAAALQRSDRFQIFTAGLNDSPKSALAVSFGFVVGFVAVIVCVTSLTKVYVAEVFYQKALRALGNAQNVQEGRFKPDVLARARADIMRSVEYLPQRSVYYLISAQLSLLELQQELGAEKADQNAVSARLVDAVNASSLAVQREPNNVALWQRRGEIFSAASLYAPTARTSVLDSYKEAISREPTNPALHLAWGVNQYILALDPATGKVVHKEALTAAISAFEQALALKPDFADARISVARAYEVNENIQSAILAMKDAMKFQSGIQNANVHYELSRLLFNDLLAKKEKITEGAAKESLFYVNNVLQMNPSHANALFVRGSLYEALGKTDLARADFLAIQKNNPENEMVQQKLESLKNAGKEAESAPSRVVPDAVNEDQTAPPIL